MERSSSEEEVLVDSSLEESWTIVDANELNEGQSLSPDCNSDIEVIDEDGEHHNHQREVSDENLRPSRSSFNNLNLLFGHLANRNGSYDSLTDQELDLTPGVKAYRHVPNESVNLWLNISLLVTCACVAGLGLGNYYGSMWSESPTEQMKRVEKQLTDCLQNQEMLLQNISSISKILVEQQQHNMSMSTPSPYALYFKSPLHHPLNDIDNEDSSPIPFSHHHHMDDHVMTALITPSDHHELASVLPVFDVLQPSEKKQESKAPINQVVKTKSDSKVKNRGDKVESEESSDENEEEEEIDSDESPDVNDQDSHRYRSQHHTNHHTSSIGRYAIVRPKFNEHVGNTIKKSSKEERVTSTREDKIKEDDDTSGMYSLKRDQLPKEEIVKKMHQRKPSVSIPPSTEKEKEQRETKRKKSSDDIRRQNFANSQRDKEIVIETSIFLEIPSSKGNGDGMTIWLLLSDKGTSQPVFFPSTCISPRERKRYVDFIFKPFLKNSFGRTESYQIWSESSYPHSTVWGSDVDVVPPNSNPWYRNQKKLVKNFWSNLKKNIYNGVKKAGKKSSKVVLDDKHLRGQVAEALLSLPESHYLEEAFSRLRSKVRKRSA